MDFLISWLNLITAMDDFFANIIFPLTHVIFLIPHKSDIIELNEKIKKIKDIQ